MDCRRRPSPHKIETVLLRTSGYKHAFFRGGSAGGPSRTSCGVASPVESPERNRLRMRSLGLRKVVTLTSWVVILANSLSISAFANSEQDLQTKTPIDRQIAAQPASASNVAL